jgi:hypothetical protein
MQHHCELEYFEACLEAAEVAPAAINPLNARQIFPLFTL